MLARFGSRSTFLVRVAFLTVLILTASSVSAAPGDLDPTFDSDGKVTTDFQVGNDEAHGIAIQAHGKIVAVGATTCGSCDAPNRGFAVARYNTDGSLDPVQGVPRLVEEVVDPMPIAIHPVLLNRKFLRLMEAAHERKP